MGAGKYYRGQRLDERQEGHHVEGDLSLPTDVQEGRRAPTKDDVRKMTDDIRWYVDRNIQHGQLYIVTQALYRREDRERMVDWWVQQGYNVEVGWVRPGFWKNLRQVWRRGPRWTIYWLVSKPFFQKPGAHHEFSVFS